MNAPSNANTSGVVEKLVERARVSTDPLLAMYAVEASKALVTAASAQARIAELEAERDQIAGESIWWKAVIGDGEYTPSDEVPSIKHLHPAMVKPIYDAHKGTAVADVIAGLIFSRAITENREQFLVGYHIARATAAEARADRLAKALDAVEAKAKVMIDSHKLVGPRAFDGHPRLHKAWAASRYGDGKEIKKTIRAALQQETQP